MKRLLSIVLALVLVLGTLPVFAYDYNVAGKTAGQMLYDNGFISGNNGNLMEAEKLNRAQLAKILCVLYGKEKEAEAFEANHGFTDVPAGHWANPWIAYAKQEGWMKGRNEKTFDPNGTVDEKQLATVLLRVLGFETKDDEYNNAAQIFAAKTAIVLDANKAFSRGQAFDAIWPAVSTPVKADGKILGEVVGKLNPPTPDPLSIKDVQANNLKEIVVKFSKEVKDVTKESFSLSDNLKISNVKLSDDALSVVITTETKMTNQSKYKLSVSGIKPLDEKTPKFVDVKDLEFDCFDKELPTVTNVEFTGPKHITISFSEPIQMGSGEITVKQGAKSYYVSTPNTSWGEKMVTFQFGEDFAADKEYTIKIQNFKDLAGYENVKAVENKVYAKDTEKPTYEIVKATQETVTLKFSKPVKNIRISDFAHTFSAYSAVEINDSTSAITKPVSQVEVRFWKKGTPSTGHALSEGKVKFMIMGRDIVDLWGNSLGNDEVELTITGDTVKPTVAVEVVSANKLRATFSKPVDLKKQDVSVKKGTTTISVSSVAFVANTAQKVWDINTTGVSEGDTIDVKIENTKDTTVNANQLDTYNVSFTIEDKTPPVLKKITYACADVNGADKEAVLTYWFDSALDSSALNTENFYFQIYNSTDKVLETVKFTGSASFLPGNNAVKLVTTDVPLKKKLFTGVDTLKAGSAAGEQLFVVKGIKDQNNNTADQKAHDTYGNAAFFMAHTANKAKIESVDVLSATTCVVNFSNVVTQISSQNLTLKPNGTAQNFEIASVEGTAVKINLIPDAVGTTTITNQFSPDKAGAEIQAKAAANGDKIVTLEGLDVDTVAVNAANFVDKIAPEFVNAGTANNPLFKAVVAKAGVSDVDTTITFELTENIAFAKAGIYLGEQMTIKYSDNGAAEVTLKPVADYGSKYEVTVSAKTLVVTLKGVKLHDNDNTDKLTIEFTDDAFKQIQDTATKPNLAKKFGTAKYEFTKLP